LGSAHRDQVSKFSVVLVLHMASGQLPEVSRNVVLTRKHNVFKSKVMRAAMFHIVTSICQILTLYLSLLCLLTLAATILARRSDVI
jgi:hypothetical protein